MRERIKSFFEECAVKCCGGSNSYPFLEFYTHTQISHTFSMSIHVRVGSKVKNITTLHLVNIVAPWLRDEKFLSFLSLFLVLTSSNVLKSNLKEQLPVPSSLERLRVYRSREHDRFSPGHVTRGVQTWSLIMAFSNSEWREMCNCQASRINWLWRSSWFGKKIEFE